MASEPITTPEAAICEALGTITQLDGRVYPLEGLKSAAAPFVVYFRQQWEAEEDLHGTIALEKAIFELDLITETYADLVSISGSLQEKLLGLKCEEYDGLTIERSTLRQTSPDIREHEVDLYRRMFVLQINYQKEEISHE